MLFFERVVDRHIMGIEIPSAALLSFNPVFVLISSPFVILLSEKLTIKDSEVDGFFKKSIGFLLTSLSFFILALSCVQREETVSLYWIVGAILIQALGELWIVPIGFSNISKLAPPRFKSLMMSFWLMAISYGHYLGGFIAQFSIVDPLKSESTLQHYHTFFLKVALMPCIVALILFLYCYVKQSKIILRINRHLKT